MNQSMKKSQNEIMEEQIFAQEFNTSNYKKYLRNIENDGQFSSLSRNSPAKTHANTQQDAKQLQLVTNYSSQLQVSRFVLPDQQVMSPENFQTCLSQPQLIYSQQLASNQVMDVIHTPKHNEFGSSNGALSVEKKSNKSKSNKSKTKKSRKKSKQQSRQVSEDFDFGGSYFNPDSAQIPLQNGQSYPFSGTSSSHDEQITKLNATKKKKSNKSGKKKIKNPNLSQFILSPGSQQQKKKKMVKKQNVERIHSEANDLTQAQLDHILMSPQSQQQFNEGTFTKQSSQDQFTFNTKARVKSHSKSKSTRKSRIKKDTFGTSQTISSFALGTQELNEEIQMIVQHQPALIEDTIELKAKKNTSAVSRTNCQNSPRAVISLVPKKVETSNHKTILQKQISKQVLQQNRLLGNIISTPIRRNRGNRLHERISNSNSSQKKIMLYANDSEYQTAEEQENFNSKKTVLSKIQNENVKPTESIEEMSGCQMKKHQSLNGMFKIQSETKTSILQYGQINLDNDKPKLFGSPNDVVSPEPKLKSQEKIVSTPKRPTHLKNKLSSSKQFSAVNLQSPFNYKVEQKVGLNKYGSQKYFKQSSLSKHLTKKSMPNIPQNLDEIKVDESEQEIFQTAGIKSDDLRHDVVHKRKSSNIQDYIQLRANNIAGSVLGHNTSTYPSRVGASQTKQSISNTYKVKKVVETQAKQSKSSTDLNLNFSQRMLKKTPIGQKNGMSQSSSGLNFENLKSLKTISGGALSGALSTVNKSGTMAGVGQNSSTGLKSSSTQQATLRGKPQKQNFFTSQSKKNLNEMESGFQSGSLEEKETNYQRSKNSSQSFNRGNSDNFKFKDNMSGRSSKEASLENILEQEDDIIDLQMGDDSLAGEKDNKEEVSLEQVDINFKSEEEDPLLNPRSNRVRNSKTVGVKAKIDKKYTTTKSSITSALMGSMAKKASSNLAYQIPIARKSQFRNKRPSDSTNVPLQILGSLKKPQQTSFNHDLEVASPNKLVRDLEKSASKPGSYAQQLLMAHRQDAGRNRVRTQVRSGLQTQTQYSRGTTHQLNDQLILDRQRELKESLKAKLEQKTKDKETQKVMSSTSLTGAQTGQGAKNIYPTRPGTSLQETRDATKLKSSEKPTPVLQAKKEVRTTLGQKKQSLPYTHSNLIMQTKIGNEEPKNTGENEMSGHQSIKAKTSAMILGKTGVTRNGSQSRQPSHKAAATGGSLHANVGQGTSTNNRISVTSKQTVAIGSQKFAKVTKTPITASVSTSLGRGPGAQPQKYQLLDCEKEKFGDRCPAGFKKIDLLGKGGIALVWLAEAKDASRQRVALKQFPKSRGQPLDSSAKIEIETLSTLFPFEATESCDGLGNQQSERGYAVDPKENPGIRSIARLIDQIEDKQDFWLVYEVGSKCLGKHLAEVKGEFYKGERIYNVAHQGFYRALAKDNKILATLIRKIAETFDVLGNFGIVHSDIKPDNILVELNQSGSDIQEVKLIDFGSAFQFHNVTQISATTPEYLAPEILDYLEQRSKNSKSNLASAVSLSKTCQPWSFDVWSLGIILLEIITGFPVWMSLKCRVTTATGKSLLGSGLFGVQGREGKRILTKQQQVLKNLPATLKKHECYGLDQNPDFMDLLNKMLDWNPSRRIAPRDIIDHPFCSQ